MPGFSYNVQSPVLSTHQVHPGTSESRLHIVGIYWSIDEWDCGEKREDIIPADGICTYV